MSWSFGKSLEGMDEAWRSYEGAVQEKARGKTPHIPSAPLKGLGNAYKIKLPSAGYRLVYRVSDEVLIVTVIAIGKRAGGDVYQAATRR